MMMMKLLLLVTAVLLLCVTSTNAGRRDVTKAVTFRGSHTLDSESFLTVGKDSASSAIQKSLIQFNNILPSCVAVSSAKMRVYFTGFHTSGPREIKAYQVLESWIVSQVTDPGPNIAGQGYPTAGVNVRADRPPGFIEFDITPIVQNWVQGGDDNYGIMLLPTDEGIIGKSPRFVSDEGPVEKRPYLIVEC